MLMPLNKKCHKPWIKQLIQDHKSILKEILTKTKCNWGKFLHYVVSKAFKMVNSR